MTPNYFGSGTPTDSYFSTTRFSTEPSLRDELIKMFDGEYPEIPKAQDGLLRRMRREDGETIPCECVSNFGEHDKDRRCPICFGEGKLFDEISIRLYKTMGGSAIARNISEKIIQPGLINIPLVVFYVRYSDTITREDKIVTLLLDEEGNRVTPLTRTGVYKISELWDYRSDNGRIEYWAIYSHLDNIKYK